MRVDLFDFDLTPERIALRPVRPRDAARMLPFVGMLLFLMPVLWAQGDGTRDGTATDGIYLFAVWIGLVVLAAAMACTISSRSSGVTHSSASSDSTQSWRASASAAFLVSR